MYTSAIGYVIVGKYVSYGHKQLIMNDFRSKHLKVIRASLILEFENDRGQFHHTFF